MRNKVPLRATSSGRVRAYLDLLQHGAAEAEVDPGVRRRVQGREEGQDHEHGVNVLPFCEERGGIRRETI